MKKREDAAPAHLLVRAIAVLRATLRVPGTRRYDNRPAMTPVTDPNESVR